MFGPIHINRLVVVAVLVAAATSMSSAQTVYVDDDAPSPGDGLAWATAYTDLQLALADAAGSGGTVTEIRVAQGTYKPTTGSDRTATFQLLNGVSILGGFPNGGGARDPDTFATTLSGDIGTGSDDSYHVVTGTGTDATAILDGFVITGGRADSGGLPNGFGAGMLIYPSGSPIVSNCTFTANFAQFGAGMGNFGGNPTVANCTFSGNVAVQQGGGAYTNATGSPIVITNCVFRGNSSPTAGGLYVNSKAEVTNCVFTGNSATGTTTASGRGGGMHSLNVGLDLTVANCTFSGNTAKEGGGMNNRSSASPEPKVNNCIFWDNLALAPGGGNEVFSSGSEPTFKSCDIAGSGGSSAGWDTLLGVDGGGNIDLDPQFADVDLRLAAGSPCLDAGDNSVVTAATDLDGNARIANGTVDMGAYELQQVLVDPEQAARDLADDILSLDLDLFNGPNANANAGRGNSLANRANEAADFIADGDIPSAIDVLTSLLQKIDGQSPPPDWMDDGLTEKTDLAAEVSALIALLQSLLP